MMYQANLSDELIVDNFAGGGGASTAIEQALHRRVDIAINHDPEAIAMHEMNHPHTKHYCESVWDVDPLQVTQGKPVGLAWFSPDCKHFSKAKGAAPKCSKIRALAWVTLRWVAKVKPRILFLENVEEFESWGPLNKKSQKTGLPCPKNKGRTFKSFVNALKRHGYKVEWREIRACDYGAPTIRKRLFLIARCDGQPIVWPEPTHGPEGSGLLPYKTAADCIDWSIDCPSIFERKRPLVENTLRRIAKGLDRYVINAEKPFIIPIGYGERAGQKPRCNNIDEPLGTIVASSTKHAVVKPKVAPFITEHANGSNQRNMPLNSPLRTLCAQPKGGHFAIAAPFIMKMRGTNVGHDITEPLHTISAGGTHHAQVRPFLIKYYGAEKDGCPLNGPIHTVTAKERFGFVTVSTKPAIDLSAYPPELISRARKVANLMRAHGLWDDREFVTIEKDGDLWIVYDIGMRMLAPVELYKAQGFPISYIFDRITVNGEMKKLSKKAAVRMCGNSVSPPPAVALIKANMPPSLMHEQPNKAA